MRLTMLVILVSAIIATLAIPLQANDTAMGAVGGTLQPMAEHPSIRMVSEDIRIQVRPDKISVTCKFIFRNEGKAVDVEMGFPEDHGGDSSGFAYFRARVDGKPVTVAHAKTKHNDMGGGRDWWVKTVHFEPGQTRVVEDFYGGNPSGDSLGGTWVTYVLKTGKNWKGPIGHAVITMDLSAVSDFQTLVPSPAGYRKQGNSITWEWRDFEPRDDIRLSYTWNYTRFIVDGRDVSGMSPYHRSWPLEMRISHSRVVHGLLMVSYTMIKDVLPEISCERLPGMKNVVLMKYRDKSLQLKAGTPTAYLNGKALTLPRPPRIEDDHLVIPFVSVGQALGFKITRDHESGKTYINSPPAATDKPAPPPGKA